MKRFIIALCAAGAAVAVILSLGTHTGPKAIKPAWIVHPSS